MKDEYGKSHPDKTWEPQPVLTQRRKDTEIRKEAAKRKNKKRGRRLIKFLSLTSSSLYLFSRSAACLRIFAPLRQNWLWLPNFIQKR
jgi:hypothetical protein